MLEYKIKSTCTLNVVKKDNTKIIVYLNLNFFKNDAKNIKKIFHTNFSACTWQKEKRSNLIKNLSNVVAPL